jgi:small neutral amino acid transporter SnatA (MarC family)
MTEMILGLGDDLGARVVARLIGGLLLAVGVRLIVTGVPGDRL